MNARQTLQNFKSNMTVCLFINVFCKSCELEPVLAVLQIKTKTISRSQSWQNAWIIKQTVVLLWTFWRKYGSVSYLFSCISTYFCLLWFSNNIQCEKSKQTANYVKNSEFVDSVFGVAFDEADISSD